MENFGALNFELTEEDMDVIKTMDGNYRTNQPACPILGGSMNKESGKFSK